MRVGIEPTCAGLQPATWPLGHRIGVAPARVELATWASEARDQIRWWSSPLGESRTHAAEVRSPGARSAGEGEPVGGHQKGWRESNPLCLLGGQECSRQTPHPRTRLQGIEP